MMLEHLSCWIVLCCKSSDSADYQGAVFLGQIQLHISFGYIAAKENRNLVHA